MSCDERGERAAAERVVAAEPVDGQPVVGGLRPLTLTCAVEAGDLHGGADGDRLDDVRRGRAVDDDGVRGRVPGPADAEIDVDVATSVAARSLTVTVSAPPRALSASVSTSWCRMTMLPRLRVSLSWARRRRRGEDLGAAEPLKRSVSAPLPPSTTSLPSPGSQTKSIGAGAQGGSVGACVPSTVSMPVTPFSVSAKRPPISVSLPGPPFRIVVSVFVNAPRDLVDPQAVVAETARDDDPREPAA